MTEQGQRKGPDKIRKPTSQPEGVIVGMVEKIFMGARPDTTTPDEKGAMDEAILKVKTLKS